MKRPSAARDTGYRWCELELAAKLHGTSRHSLIKVLLGGTVRGSAAGRVAKALAALGPATGPRAADLETRDLEALAEEPDE